MLQTGLPFGERKMAPPAVEAIDIGRLVGVPQTARTMAGGISLRTRSRQRFRARRKSRPVIGTPQIEHRDSVLEARAIYPDAIVGLAMIRRLGSMGSPQEFDGREVPTIQCLQLDGSLGPARRREGRQEQLRGIQRH